MAGCGRREANKPALPLAEPLRCSRVYVQVLRGEINYSQCTLLLGAARKFHSNFKYFFPKTVLKGFNARVVLARPYCDVVEGLEL